MTGDRPPPQRPDEHVNDDDDDSGETAPKWACPACTFLNEYDYAACDVCQEQRPGVAVPPPTSGNLAAPAAPATPNVDVVELLHLRPVLE